MKSSPSGSHRVPALSRWLGTAVGARWGGEGGRGGGYAPGYLLSCDGVIEVDKVLAIWYLLGLQHLVSVLAGLPEGEGGLQAIWVVEKVGQETGAYGKRICGLLLEVVGRMDSGVVVLVTCMGLRRKSRESPRLDKRLSST